MLLCKYTLLGDTMLKLRKYISKKKYILFFLLCLFLFGASIGLFLGIRNIDFLKESVVYYVSNISSQSYNYMLIHFFLLVLCFATSFIGIGVPLLCTVLFYEGLTSGFLIGIFLMTYQIGGFLFSLIFLIITKMAYILILTLFFLKTLEIARKMIGKYIYKTDPSIAITRLMKGCIYLILIAFINDIFVFFFGNKILPLFHFLLS